jgi:hypothetical protein
MLPIAAPVTAPAVCFGIGGTWISSDDGGLLAIAAIVNVSRVIAPVHITLSLPCGEQRTQNPTA